MKNPVKSVLVSNAFHLPQILRKLVHALSVFLNTTNESLLYAVKNKNNLKSLILLDVRKKISLFLIWTTCLFKVLTAYQG